MSLLDAANRRYFAVFSACARLRPKWNISPREYIAGTKMNNRAYSDRYAAFLRALQDARLESGLTQVELAARLGETQSFVSKCERGTRRVDIAELQAFCQANVYPVE